MGLPDLRLDGFLPGLSVPPESAIPLSIAINILLVCIYLLTYTSTWAFLIRLSLLPLAFYGFYEHAYGPYPTPGVEVDVGLAVVGLYGMMRVLETLAVDTIDPVRPYWIRTSTGGRLPDPTTFLGRLGYAIDLTFSLRGTSYFADTHWSWASKDVLTTWPVYATRTTFILRSIRSLIIQYVCLDILDSLNKSRSWPLDMPYPITSLSVPEQLVFAFSICGGTALSISFPYTLISLVSVSLGSNPSGWPPMFIHPFNASSLADFWTRRWHAIFRRVFDRISFIILRIVPIKEIPVAVRRTIRATVIFTLSATLHVLLMHKVDIRLAAEHQLVAGEDATPLQRTALDPQIFKFFLVQPLGLLIEAAILVPLSNAFGVKWVTRVWAWAFLLWSGRYWADVWVHRQFWHERERTVGWSIIRGVWKNEWAV